MVHFNNKVWRDYWQKRHSLQKQIENQSIRSGNIIVAADVAGREHTCGNLTSAEYALGNWPYQGKFLE